MLICTYVAHIVILRNQICISHRLVAARKFEWTEKTIYILKAKLIIHQVVSLYCTYVCSYINYCCGYGT